MRSPDNNTLVTLDDFRACEWAKVIASIPNKECVSYFEAFRTKAEEAKANGQERTRIVFEVLRDICAFGFEHSSGYRPFPADDDVGES